MTETVVVTGASTGIGRALVEDLVHRGYDTVGTVRRTHDAWELESLGARPVMVDVTDDDAGQRVLSAIPEGASLRGLINNAGIVVAGALERVTEDELRRVLEVNVIGAHRMTRALLPKLRESRGRVIQMSSVSGLVASPYLGPYAASKFALEALSDSLRREVAPHGVQVVLIEPGPIRTPIWAKSFGPVEEAGQDPIYGAQLRRVADGARQAESGALPPESVVKAVVEALTRDRPRSRMMVTPGSPWLYRLARILPTRWLDSRFRKRFRETRP